MCAMRLLLRLPIIAIRAGQGQTLLVAKEEDVSKKSEKSRADDALKQGRGEGTEASPLSRVQIRLKPIASG